MEDVLRYLSYGFIVVGGVIALTGGLSFLAEAYKSHVLWLVCCILLPPVIIIFSVTHWSVTKEAFLTMTTGAITIALGMLLLDAIYK